MKPWRRKWWGILLLVVFYPITIFWLLWYKTSWKNIIKIFLTIPLLFVFLFHSLFIYFLFNPQASSKRPQSTKQEVIKENVSPTITPAPLPTQTSEIKVKPSVFDVPNLVGKNINEVRSILGKPADGSLTEPNNAQLQQGVQEWDNTFKKDGVELLITFNPSTRKITDFFIGTIDPSGTTSNKKQLLNLGNLTTVDSSYSVEYVQARKYPNRFTGIKIIPN